MNTPYGNSQIAPAWSGKLKDQPAGERPRERLIEHGAAALSAAELIAILVKTGLPGTNALDIGKQLIQKFGSLGAKILDDNQHTVFFAGELSGKSYLLKRISTILAERQKLTLMLNSSHLSVIPHSVERLIADALKFISPQQVDSIAKGSRDADCHCV